MLVLALAVQLAATWWFVRRRGAPASRAQLALVCAGTMPLLGVALALAAVGLRGSGRLAGNPVTPVRLRPGRLALGATGAPLLDRLTGSAAERRNALAGLTRNGDAEAVATLRWLIARGSPDAVVEAALAIDELAHRREQRARELCAAAEREPSFERLRAAADALADLVVSGLADPTLVPRIAADAGDLYRRADAMRGRRHAAMIERWARLELAAARPREALALLSMEREAADPDTAARLLDLRRDAAFAARTSVEAAG